jgi:hypothetical protein
MTTTTKRTSKYLLALIRHGGLVMLAPALLGCEPNEAPSAGQISLTFDRLSGSDATFLLANGLDQAIYIRGNLMPSLAIRTWPRDTGIGCETIPNLRSEEEPLGFAHGKATYFEVLPGERIKLVVPTTLPQRYKGGLCRISLVLRDGSLVGPVEFHP